jgi:hypothetical protein
MSWADCGTDSRGRRIGYAYLARCDQPDCHRRIDRGLTFVCGRMHGGEIFGCGGYFCYEHLLLCICRKDHPKLCPACDRVVHRTSRRRHR